MKITIATGPIFPVPAVRGGAVQRLWEGLAREFTKRGHEVTIFAREFPGQPKEETVDGIRFVRRGGYAQSTSIKRDLVQCLLYALKTARYVPPGDVVVTNDFWMPAVLPWLKPSAGKVVPCLQRFPKNQGWLYGKCAALAAVSRAVAEAVKVQSPSVASKVVVVPNAIDEVFLEKSVERGAGSGGGEQEAEGRGQGTGDRPSGSESQPEQRGDGSQSDQLIRVGEGQEPISIRHTAEVIRGDGREEPEAVRPEIAQRQPQEARGRRQAADGGRAVRILYVGRIHPEKGLRLLAEALERIRQTADGARHEAEGERKTAGGRRHEVEGGRHAADGIRQEALDWECVLVGPVKQSEGGGGEKFAEELKRQMAGLPVRFEAPVYDPAALAKIYERADVFVYPSVAETGEAMPLAPVEAMARGVVPVVSDLAAFREYLEPGVNGMVFDHRSHDPAENLAAALRELIGDSDRRERMGAAARKRAEGFSTAAIAERYLKLFAEKLQSGT